MADSAARIASLRSEIEEGRSEVGGLGLGFGEEEVVVVWGLSESILQPPRPR